MRIPRERAAEVERAERERAAAIGRRDWERADSERRERERERAAADMTARGKVVQVDIRLTLG